MTRTIRRKSGRYSVNPAAALVFGLDSRATYNVVRNSEHKVRNHWYVTLVNVSTGAQYEEIPRSKLFDRWEAERKRREAEQRRLEAECRERERRQVVTADGWFSLDELRQLVEKDELIEPCIVSGLLDRIEQLLEEIDNCDC